uniref:Uncharacterized protein n=1 Tax=Arundo donax TaxID=35708 RepID=A0A0A9B7M4_ARUDO
MMIISFCYSQVKRERE